MKKLLFVSFFVFLIYLNAGAQIYQGSTTVNGGNMTALVTVNSIQNTVELKLSGPSTQWFGFGFGGSSMANRYSIITTGAGVTEERKLGNHNAGTNLASSFTNSSSSVNAGVREVTITRSITGLNTNYYTFPNGAGSISMIWARGSSSTLSQHSGANRGSTFITLSNACNIPPTVLSNVNVCNGDSISIFGKFRTAAGLYKDTLTSSIGCDSVLEQTLVVQPSGTYTVPAITICQGDSALILGQYRNTAGVYNQQLTSSMGCDSIREQELILNTVDTSVVNNNDTLMANVAGATYLWIDCSGMLLGVPNTNQFLLPPAGNYRVVVTKDGCSDTSGCHFTNGFFSIEENRISGAEIYPNPAKEMLFIETDPQWLNGHLSIYNIDGRLIQTLKIIEIKTTLNLNNYSRGMYFIRLQKGNQSEGTTILLD